MAKLFGEFLIDKRLVSQEQLLEALIAQIKSVRPTPEVVFEHKLLPKDAQVKILAHQHKSCIDYKSSAEVLGFWNDELASKINQITQTKRRPLGEILVNLGYLSTQKLAENLELFLQYITDANLNLSPTKARRNEISCDRIDPILIQEYIRNFKTKIEPLFKSVINTLATPSLGRGVLRETIASAKSEFIGLRASASFLKADRTQSLVSELVTTLELIQSRNLIPDLNILQDLMKSSYDVYECINQILIELGNDQFIESDPNLSNLLERITKFHESLRSKSLVSGE